MKCVRCDGTGIESEDESTVTLCPWCKGSGQTTMKEYRNMKPSDQIPDEPYVIIASDRVLVGMRVRGERAAELIDKYSPTSVLPDSWCLFPVVRTDR